MRYIVRGNSQISSILNTAHSYMYRDPALDENIMVRIEGISCLNNKGNPLITFYCLIMRLTMC